MDIGLFEDQLAIGGALNVFLVHLCRGQIEKKEAFIVKRLAAPPFKMVKPQSTTI